jgi:beta-glucosidase
VAQLSLDGGKTNLLDSHSMFDQHNSVIETRNGLENASIRIRMQAGDVKRIQIVAEAGKVGPFSALVADEHAPMQFRFAWETPSQRQTQMSQAVAAAKQAKTVVVFGYNEGTEGIDRRRLALPYHQDHLIAAVAKANPNTIVVLNTGDPITMPWVNDVAAILQMWYPGQSGGLATAQLLLGKANPSGKLPVSFPVDKRDLPMQKARQFPGVHGQLDYEEGIYVGYRWFDKARVKPLFPFGHGLSYTRFKYSDARILATENGYRVQFKITNTGYMKGSDVPQIYLGAPEQAPAPVAVKSLIGFERVSLRAGQSKRITVSVHEDQLNYWNSALHRWSRLSGKRPIYLGHSAGDYRQVGEIVVE